MTCAWIPKKGRPSHLWIRLDHQPLFRAGTPDSGQSQTRLDSVPLILFWSSEWLFRLINWPIMIILVLISHLASPYEPCDCLTWLLQCKFHLYQPFNYWKLAATHTAPPLTFTVKLILHDYLPRGVSQQDEASTQFDFFTTTRSCPSGAP